MKKLLTIVGLAMLLCLAISVALAGTETNMDGYTEAQIKLFASEGYLPDSTRIYGTDLDEVKLASPHNADRPVKLYTNPSFTTFKLVTVNVNPHVAGTWSTEKAATCVSTGVKATKCKVCGEKLTDTIAKITGHSVAGGQYVYRTVDDPKGEDYGKSRLYCTVCKVWIPDSEAGTYPTHEHTWIEKIVKLPTCANGFAKNGKYEEACKVCGINKNVYLFGWYRDYDISVADFNAHPYLVLENGGWGIDGHKWVNWVDSTPATCLSPIKQIRWCSICELKQERNKPGSVPLAPVYACDMDPATITCQTTAAEVTWTCSLCKGANPAHKNQPSIYTAAEGKFESPDLKVAVKANHVFDWNDDSTYVLDGAGKVKVFKAADRIGEKKCTEGDYKWAKCVKCGATVQAGKVYVAEATGHDWTEWQLVAAPGESGNVDGLWNRTCKRCGKTVSFTGPKQPSDLCEAHVPVLNEEDSYAATCEDEGLACYVCEVCGTHLKDEVIPALGHDYKVIPEVAATCTTAGKGIKVCTVCNDVVKDVVIEKLGHKFGEWTVTKEATTEAEGEETRECERCGEKETRKIAKLDKDAKYDVEDLDYTNPVATGTAKLVEGTKALKNAYARVTFFLANGDCMIQIVDVAEDGTFKAGAIGNFVHISVVIVDVDDAYGADEAIEHAHGNAGIKL